ncbi:peptidase M23 [Rhodobacteraceae bacterium WD3A24]|nr:peptidase M23 [Rhodobacteraceae bacterium WD3A24]
MARLADRLNNGLERLLPERRLFLRSDAETRFIRLRPVTQAIGLGGGGLVVAWSIIATAIILMDTIGAGNVRDQAQREQFVYEARLNALAAERDQRAEEARAAQERFSLAMERVSEMQTALLNSEERRQELETGIEVIQRTLRSTMEERDTARAEAAQFRAALQDDPDGVREGSRRSADVDGTLAFLTRALSGTAEERDSLANAATQARQQLEHLALEYRLLEDRNERIFSRLEEAVSVSMEPLERMFTAAGLPPERVIETVRRGYQRSESLSPIAISTQGSLDPDSDEARAQGIMDGLERINMYRVAAQRAPFARPVAAGARQTSDFGPRRDPINGGTRHHDGHDWAAGSGTPIYATGDGVVTHAGWRGGYGRVIIIEHDFGLETVYAHLSRTRVREGQRVSRGDRIGDMGSTGRSTGTHLHYEVRAGGRPVNPMTYIRAARDVF